MTCNDCGHPNTFHVAGVGRCIITNCTCSTFDLAPKECGWCGWPRFRTEHADFCATVDPTMARVLADHSVEASIEWYLRRHGLTRAEFTASAAHCRAERGMRMS